MDLGSKVIQRLAKTLFFANSEMVTHCYHCIKHVRVVILFKNVVFLINKCLRTLSICGSYPVSGNYFSFERYPVRNYLVTGKLENDIWHIPKQNTLKFRQ